jgi:hypothetical protein
MATLKVLRAFTGATVSWMAPISENAGGEKEARIPARKARARRRVVKRRCAGTKTHMPSRHAAFGAKFIGGVRLNTSLIGLNLRPGGGSMISLGSKSPPARMLSQRLVAG